MSHPPTDPHRQTRAEELLAHQQHLLDELNAVVTHLRQELDAVKADQARLTKTVARLVEAYEAAE